MGLKGFFSLFESAEEKMGRRQAEYLQSYHYQRAEELFHHERDADAFDELQLELKEHGDNAAAHYLIALINARYNLYGEALKAINYVIYLLNKTTDKEFLSKAYCLRAKINRVMNNGWEWCLDAQDALKCMPDNVCALEELGDYYYYQGDYDASDVQFGRIMKIQSHRSYSYLGHGRNEQKRNAHEEAIRQFDKAIQLDASNPEAYSYMAESLLALGRTSEAVDAVITALSIDMNDEKAGEMLNKLIDAAPTVVSLKIKAKAIQDRDNDYWYGLLGCFYSRQGDDKAVIAAYHKAYQIGEDPNCFYAKAVGWHRLGVNDKAIEEAETGIKRMAQSYDLQKNLAVYKAEEGRLDEAMADITSLTQQQPDDWDLYYRRGRFLFETGQYEDAVKDFDVSLSLNGKYAMAMLYKGWALSEIGKEAEAAEVLNSIVEKESALDDTRDAVPMALYFLNRCEEAEQRCQEIDAEIEAEGLRSVNDYYYYAYFYMAAVYCRTGKTDKALECMRRSVEQGYRRLWYMMHGKLLAPMCEEKEFQDIVNDVRNRIAKDKEEVLASLYDIPTEEQTHDKSEVPFTREGKMCKVKCEINGLPLHFIFDTGASDVTMSSVEATFMLKNGYLSESDLSGKQYYSTADGSIAEGVKVRLGNVEFAGFTLKNVKASIVTNQRAPLLFGQSVLERFGRIEIDNNRKLIRLNS